MGKRKRKRKNKRVPKNRTRYEGELVKLIGTARPDLFVSSSGNTAGWDLFVIGNRGKRFIPVEVKTSSTTKNINLAYNDRVKKQYRKYAGILKKHKINTWYAFRYVSRKGRLKKEQKWRFVPIANIDQMILSFEQGISLEEFVNVIL